MSEPVKKIVRVLEAEYVKEAESIVMVCECDNGRLRHQIHKSCFNFNGRDPDYEMEKTAKMMIGKPITMVFDTDLTEKIKNKDPLRYK